MGAVGPSSSGSCISEKKAKAGSFLSISSLARYLERFSNLYRDKGDSRTKVNVQLNISAKLKHD